MPYINDWACVSGGAYLGPILEGLFGVRSTVAGEIAASPRFAGFDPGTELRGLRYQGHDYTVTREGIKRIRL